MLVMIFYCDVDAYLKLMFILKIGSSEYNLNKLNLNICTSYVLRLKE